MRRSIVRLRGCRPRLGAPWRSRSRWRRCSRSRSWRALAATVGRVDPAAAAGTATFTPVADSYVQSDQPRTNYGTQTQLRADGTPVVRAYLRFNPQGLTGTVTSAVLRIRTNSAHPKGWSVSGVASTTWGETTITYGTAPPLSSPAYGPSGSLRPAPGPRSR
jgi:hypothetical protein